MIAVSGFGELYEDFVQQRTPGLSYTCREARAEINVQNDSNVVISFVRLDGGFFPTGDACDFSVSSQSERSVGLLIELKGHHVDHAIEQLARSLSRLRERGVSVRYRLAAVVSSGGANIPTSAWKKAQKTFLRQTGVSLARFQNHSSKGFLASVA